MTTDEKIIVIGIGGAGGNFINLLAETDLAGFSMLVADTDAAALNKVYSKRVLLGEKINRGLGTGGKPELGIAAVDETLLEIQEHIKGKDLAVILYGAGGGTGTGAAPVIAHTCKEQGILTVAIVTTPFDFEGKKRAKIAEDGIERLKREGAELKIVSNNDMLALKGATDVADVTNIIIQESLEKILEQFRSGQKINLL